MNFVFIPDKLARYLTDKNKYIHTGTGLDDPVSRGVDSFEESVAQECCNKITSIILHRLISNYQRNCRPTQHQCNIKLLKQNIHLLSR